MLNVLFWQEENILHIEREIKLRIGNCATSSLSHNNFLEIDPRRHANGDCLPAAFVLWKASHDICSLDEGKLENNLFLARQEMAEGILNLFVQFCITSFEYRNLFYFFSSSSSLCTRYCGSEYCFIVGSQFRNCFTWTCVALYPKCYSCTWWVVFFLSLSFLFLKFSRNMAGNCWTVGY